MRMTRSFWSRCCVGILSFNLILQAGPLTLKKENIRPSVQEMLDYHVEYKQWSPQLARRAIKLYIEQFDSENIYLLSSEVKPFLQLSDRQLEEAVLNYQKGNSSEFSRLNQVIE